MGENQEFTDDEVSTLKAVGGDFETFFRTFDSVFKANKSVSSSYDLYTETDFSIVSKVRRCLLQLLNNLF